MSLKWEILIWFNLGWNSVTDNESGINPIDFSVP